MSGGGMGWMGDCDCCLTFLCVLMGLCNRMLTMMPMSHMKTVAPRMDVGDAKSSKHSLKKRNKMKFRI